MTSKNSKLWSVLSGVISGVFLIDMITWLVSGQGIAELVGGGSDNPLLITIVEHLGTIPDWSFFLVCALSVVVLSAIMTASILASSKSRRF